MTESPSHSILHTIRIAAHTRPGQAAAAIKGYLLKDATVTVCAIGPIAIDRATRAISLAGLYLYEDGLPNIECQIVGERIVTENIDNLVIIRWHCHLPK
jgi:stage V sporulation protein SpoVS